MESSSTKSGRRRKALPGAVLICVALAASFCGCPQRTTAPAHTAEGLSTECTAQMRSAELRAGLAVAALLAYGRLDPKLYVLDAQGGLSVSPEATVRDPAQLPPFSEALKAVLDSPEARGALMAGYEKAVAACAVDACAPTSYSFTVSPMSCEGTCVEWNVNGPELPNDGLWEDGFHNLYAHAPLDCPLIDALAVRSTNSGSAQTSSAARTLRRTSRKPCDRCDYNGFPGRYDANLNCALTC